MNSAKLFLATCCLLLGGVVACADTAFEVALKTGAEQPAAYLPLLQDRRVGLVVNQTSQVGGKGTEGNTVGSARGEGQHLIDFLRHRKVNIARIFALEHGIRGDVENGGKVEGGIDGPSGLPVVSLYGGSHAPARTDVEDLDWLLFDIQDVGVRFYTYISSLHYIMQACAEYDVPLLVLDRPNPNGDYVDGPILEEKFRSFVGMHPIPLVHGLTVGELARMINGEGWLKDGARCELTVIPVAGYTRQRHYSLPVRPSPNLPNDQSIRLYPSLGLFEGTTVSVGRGTEFPFQLLGHPRDTKGKFAFAPRPIPGVSENPKHNGEQLRGDDLRAVTPKAQLDLGYLIDWMQRSGETGEEFFARAEFFDKLAGTDKLRLALLAGKSERQIRAEWQPQLRDYLARRKPYLLYPGS